LQVSTAVFSGAVGISLGQKWLSPTPTQEKFAHMPMLVLHLAYGQCVRSAKSAAVYLL